MIRPGQQRALCDHLARALEYPGDGAAEAALAAATALAGLDRDVAGAFSALAGWLQETPRWQQEEAYTRLFDLQPACTLHVGYHVYGEAYQRGELLAGLRGELAAAGIDSGGELPDFLPVLLRLWGRLADDEDSALFGERLFAPAIASMARELGRLDHPWAAAVRSLALLWPARDSGECLPRERIEHYQEALHA